MQGIRDFTDYTGTTGKPAGIIKGIVRAMKSTGPASHETQCGYSSHPLGCKCDTEDISDTAFADMVADENF